MECEKLNAKKYTKEVGKSKKMESDYNGVYPKMCNAPKIYKKRGC